MALAYLGLGLSVRAAEPIKLASFSTVVTEIAREVGGSHVKVVDLIKPGVDPHEYQPTPEDLKVASESQLILTSGKHLDSYIDKLEDATGGKSDLLKVGDKFASLKMKPHEHGPAKGAHAHEAAEGSHEHEAGKGSHEHEAAKGTHEHDAAKGSHEHDAAKGADKSGMIEDPHWWHSIDNVKKATKVVRDELIKLDPKDKADFQANAQKYLASLDELQSWVKRKVAELPRDKRKIVTSHDAFQYFARDYGFTILAIEGVSTETEPSNRHVAELIDQVKKEGVKVIFLESMLNPKVTREITRETGAKIGGTLYADGLDTGEASTYAGMMKHNVSTIVDALK